MVRTQVTECRISLGAVEVDRAAVVFATGGILSRFSKAFLAALMPGMATCVSRLTVHTIQVA